MRAVETLRSSDVAVKTQLFKHNGVLNMTNKITIKQEKFCQKYIETGNASEAYRQAYDCQNSSDAAINVEASRMLNDPKITLRLKEYQDQHRKRHDVTVDSLTNEYEEVRHKAIQAGAFSPAIAAITGKAKLHGLIIDKAERAAKDVIPPISQEQIEVTQETIREIMNKLRDEF